MGIPEKVDIVASHPKAIDFWNFLLEVTILWFLEDLIILFSFRLALKENPYAARNHQENGN